MHLLLIATAALFESQTTVRTVASFSENPNNKDLYGYDSETSNKALVREALQVPLSDGWKAELNVYALLLGSTDKGSASTALQSGTEERNRSPKLERRWHSSHKLDGFLTVDRFNVRGSFAGTELAAGRFPIDTSTTAIFTPNDFFAPYRPFNYYREYKPGVDALRIDRAIGPTGQLSAFGVAGYESEAKIDRVGKPKERRYGAAESSVLARAAYTLSGVEGAVLAGRHGHYDVAGFTLQGEAGALGLKAEGHQRKHRDKPLDAAELAAGFDFRPMPSLLLQFEQFFNGAGYGSVPEYERVKVDEDPPIYFLGRNYSGLGAAYELTPLVNLKGMLIGNLTDNSALISTNVVYAVASNAEVSASLLLPRGKGPAGETLRSEYGSFPTIFTLETGLYW